MKLYSDTLTPADLYAACPKGVRVAILEVHPRPRKRRNGYDVGLAGTSPYSSQLTGEKAATWDEHGIWMDRLFDKDPQMIVATYNGRDEFIEQTQEFADHAARRAEIIGADHYSKTHSAPWLS